MTERKIVIEGDGAKYSVDKAEGRSHIEQGSEKRATPDRQDGDRVSGEKKEKGKGKAQSSDSSGGKYYVVSKIHNGQRLTSCQNPLTTLKQKTQE